MTGPLLPEPPPPPPGTPAPPPPPGSPPSAPEVEVADGDTDRPSRLPLVAAALVFVLLAGAGVALFRWLSTPVPCAEASFVSERFAYCVTTPEGWASAEATEDDADRFLLPTAAASVQVQAVELEGGEDTGAFVERVRGLLVDAGYELGDTATVTIDGVQATWWDAVTRSPLGDETRLRDVVMVREGIAWRVQFADDGEGFEEHVAAFDALMRSWRFA